MSAHTPGPWRWEFNEKHKDLHLVGGKPMFDLTIIRPERWGMHSATLLIRDTAHDGMNILHKLHERPDWLAPFKGREHHAYWCAAVKHPDMQLIEAAPDLLEALQALSDAYEALLADSLPKKDAHLAAKMPVLVDSRAAITKATGEQP